MRAHPAAVMGLHTTPSYPSPNAFASGTPNSSVVSMSNLPPAYILNNGSPTTRQQQQLMHTHTSAPVMALNTSAGTKLFVGQVPAVCSEEQLYPLFAQFGPLLEVKIMRESNGRSKGSAWVRYVHEESAKAAIATLHERQVVPPQTNPLRVQLAAPSGKKTYNYAAPQGGTTTSMIVPISYQQSAPGASYYASNTPQQPQPQQQTTYFTSPPTAYAYGINPSILAVSPSSIVDNQTMMAVGHVDTGVQQHQQQRSGVASYYTSLGPVARQQQVPMNGFCMPTYTMVPPRS